MANPTTAPVNLLATSDDASMSQIIRSELNRLLVRSRNEFRLVRTTVVKTDLICRAIEGTTHSATPVAINTPNNTDLITSSRPYVVGQIVRVQ